MHGIFSQFLHFDLKKYILIQGFVINKQAHLVGVKFMLELRGCVTNLNDTEPKCLDSPFAITTWPELNSLQPEQQLGRNKSIIFVNGTAPLREEIFLSEMGAAPLKNLIWIKPIWLVSLPPGVFDPQGFWS